MTAYRSPAELADGQAPRRDDTATDTSDTGTSDTEWDAFVADHPEGSLQQTSAWGRVKGNGHTVQRVVVRGDDGRIVAGAQLLGRRLAHLVGTGYVPYGPLASSLDDAEQVMDRLEVAARAAGLSALLVQPARNGFDVGAHLEHRGYRQSRIDVATSATFLVDTSQSVDELFARLMIAHHEAGIHMAEYAIENAENDEAFHALGEAAFRRDCRGDV